MANRRIHPLSPARVTKFMRARSKAIQDSVDVDDLLSEAGAELLKRIQVRFKQQVDSKGNSWSESLSSKRRRKKRGGNSTLFDTGKLYNSIRAVKTQRGGLRITTDTPYARDHQFGVEGFLPARPFMNVSKEDDTAVFNIMRSRLNRRFK